AGPREQLPRGAARGTRQARSGDPGRVRRPDAGARAHEGPSRGARGPTHLARRRGIRRRARGRRGAAFRFPTELTRPASTQHGSGAVMSVARVACRALVGLQAPLVHVEVSLASGLPAFCIVGLPATVVKESKERVRAALLNSRFEFPAGRITVNLAPAHAQQQGHELVVPRANAAEACVVAPERVRAAGHLLEVCGHLSGAAPLRACAPPRGDENRDAPSARGAPLDLADVRGQLMPKRALVIAAAGGHSLLMIGPPGSGKSMLAQRLPGLLPPLTRSEALEVAAIAAVSAA